MDSVGQVFHRTQHGIQTIYRIQTIYSIPAKRSEDLFKFHGQTLSAFNFHSVGRCGTGKPWPPQRKLKLWTGHGSHDGHDQGSQRSQGSQGAVFWLLFPLAKSKATALQPSCSEILKGKLQELQVVRYLGRPAGCHDASCLALLKNMCHDHSQNLIIWVWSCLIYATESTFLMPQTLPWQKLDKRTRKPHCRRPVASCSSRSSGSSVMFKCSARLWVVHIH